MNEIIEARHVARDDFIALDPYEVGTGGWLVTKRGQYSDGVVELHCNAPTEGVTAILTLPLRHLVIRLDGNDLRLGLVTERNHREQRLRALRPEPFTIDESKIEVVHDPERVQRLERMRATHDTHAVLPDEDGCTLDNRTDPHTHTHEEVLLGHGARRVTEDITAEAGHLGGPWMQLARHNYERERQVEAPGYPVPPEEIQFDTSWWVPVILVPGQEQPAWVPLGPTSTSRIDAEKVAATSRAHGYVTVRTVGELQVWESELMPRRL